MKKVDTMIIQAIGLLDDLDKELNTYAMRVREWYGWHFPELAKVIQDNIQYAKTVKLMGSRTNAADLDFSEILPEEVESELKEAALISMGTEVSDHDMANIKALCDQVIALSEYRAQLFDYLRSRMNAIAPNLSALVGELVGARLIAHAGSLLNLAKQPASTVQILGAEKALFRALKTKHQTPKYGLIFHASLIGQAPPKLKGKISRSLAAKSALSIRVDALGEGQDASVGLESRAKIETRLRQLEGRVLGQLSGSAKGKAKIESYDRERKGTPGLLTEAKTYNVAADSTLGQGKVGKTSESAQLEDKPLSADPSLGLGSKKKKKRKHEEDSAWDSTLGPGNAVEASDKGTELEEKAVVATPSLGSDYQKKKKRKHEEVKQIETPQIKEEPEELEEEEEEEEEKDKKDKKKKKKKKQEKESMETPQIKEEPEELEEGEKKKKKKKKKNQEKESKVGEPEEDIKLTDMAEETPRKKKKKKDKSKAPTSE